MAAPSGAVPASKRHSLRSSARRSRPTRHMRTVPAQSTLTTAPLAPARLPSGAGGAGTAAMKRRLPSAAGGTGVACSHFSTAAPLVLEPLKPPPARES